MELEATRLAALVPAVPAYSAACVPVVPAYSAAFVFPVPAYSLVPIPVSPAYLAAPRIFEALRTRRHACPALADPAHDGREAVLHVLSRTY